MRGKRVVVIGAALGLFSVVAAAQTRPRHMGLNLGIGVAQGQLRVSCTGCDFPRKDGALSLTGQVGWTLSDALIITGDMLIFTKHQEDNRGEQANTNYQMGSAVALWFPSRRWEHFLKFGAGLSHTAMSLDVDNLGLRDIRSTGPLVRFGAGTDLTIGRTWSITPFVDYSLGLASTTNVDNLKIKTSMLSFGAALSWR